MASKGSKKVLKSELKREFVWLFNSILGNKSSQKIVWIFQGIILYLKNK
jgi:hypothetical protein